MTLVTIRKCLKNTFVSVMFRHLTTILLLAAFSIQVFNRAIVVADYYLNINAYIAKCENKAAPEMNCEGKCLVSKKMNDEEKKEQNSGLKVNTNEIICLKAGYSALLPQSDTLIRIFNKNYCFCIPTNHRSEIFHPPALN